MKLLLLWGDTGRYTTLMPVFCLGGKKATVV